MLSNIWYLREVRTALGISPYTRRYWHLLPAVLGSVAAVVCFRLAAHSIRREWPVIVMSAAVSYLALAGIAAMVGLDEDDQTIAKAAWSRVRNIFGKAVVNTG